VTTLGTLSLKNIGAICAVHMPAAPTRDLIQLRVVVRSAFTGVPDDDLTMLIDEANFRGSLGLSHAVLLRHSKNVIGG